MLGVRRTRLAFLVLVLSALALVPSARAIDLSDAPVTRELDARRAERGEPDAIDTRLDGRLRRLVAPDGAGATRTTLMPGPTPWRRARSNHVVVRGTDLDVGALRRAGLRVDRSAGERVEGWVEVDRLRDVAGVAGVTAVRPVDLGRLRVGSVTSAGDVASRADLVRGLGFDGTGIRVGVISDGIDGAQTVQATGDLPPIVVPSGAGCSVGEGSEGTAILEIVHDLAPGASLFFSAGLSSTLAFIDSVRCLTAAGAQVIVDDIGFYGEPFFEDGPVALAVREAVRAGVSFHSAAGNQARAHYEGAFRASPNSRYHDFRGGPVDNVDVVLVPAGGTVTCVLQWDDPFGASGNDYDLLLLDGNQEIIDAGDTAQRGTGDPIEVVSASNPSTVTQTAGLAIQRQRGNARTLKIFCIDDVASVEYLTPSGSIFGHPAVAEAVTVGAINVADPGLDAIEPFSARGPARVVFPQTIARPKPDLAAFDGVATATPGFTPFFGTSAAAPHTAAVAALLLQKNPFLTPGDIQLALRTSALDIGAPGFDESAGAGRLDALAAVAAVPAPECFGNGDCDDANLCSTERCEEGRCVRAAAPCDDGDVCNGYEACLPEVGCIAGEPPPDGTPCPDATVCNGDESCRAGVCRSGAPLLCADTDPCTDDLCAPDSGCVFPSSAGFDSVTCALGKGLPECPGALLPASVVKRFSRAERLVARGRFALRTGRQRFRLRRSARALSQAIRITGRRAARGDLPPGCAAALTAALTDARDRARTLARSL